jgi:hypothetical protein
MGQTHLDLSKEGDQIFLESVITVATSESTRFPEAPKSLTAGWAGPAFLPRFGESRFLILRSLSERSTGRKVGGFAWARQTIISGTLRTYMQLVELIVFDLSDMNFRDLTVAQLALRTIHGNFSINPRNAGKREPDSLN